MSDDVRAVAVQDKPASLMQIIGQAVMSKDIDVDKMRALFELQKDILAEEHRISFKAAMARLQERLPQIAKYGKGKNSKFAKLEDIDTIIKPILADEGFSIDFDEASNTATTVTFVVTVSHREGHSETKRLTVPIDVASKNDRGVAIRTAIQDAGSTVSYARRYLIKMLFNIVEVGEDTDGVKRSFVTESQIRDIETLLADTKSNKDAFLSMIAGVDQLEDLPADQYKRVMNALQTKAGLKK
jgi:hypothetical protein